MELQYKPDIDKVMQRYEAWWHCEIIDRPVVSLWPKQDTKTKPPVKTFASPRDRYMDMEYAIDCYEAWASQSQFVGDTLPVFMPNIGPEVCATVFGAKLEWASEFTSYSVPCAQSCREILSIKPNLDNPFWNTIRKGTDLSIQRGKGKWITAIADLHTNGDLLASLRDPQNLCFDLVDDPQSVKAACEYVTQSYSLMYEDLYARAAAAGLPSCTWNHCPHRGRMYVSNCDFICMISPEMFQDAILPSIIWEMDYLDRNIFHLDGPGALKHLDTLLDLPQMNGLQWVYGAGNGPSAKWIDVYKRAQAKGKCLEIGAESMQDAEAIIEHIRPEGVWLRVFGSYSMDEAKAFLKRLEKWAAKG